MMLISAPPGGMRGGPGEVRRGKPLRVLQGIYARNLKLRIWSLEFWDFAKFEKELALHI